MNGETVKGPGGGRGSLSSVLIFGSFAGVCVCNNNNNNNNKRFIEIVAAVRLKIHMLQAS